MFIIIIILYYANRQQIEHTDNQHKRIKHNTSYEILDSELRNELSLNRLKTTTNNCQWTFQSSATL